MSTEEVRNSIIGYIGSILVIICLLPQFVHILVRKKSDDVSILTYCILFMGNIMWIVYGFLKSDIIILIANIISCSITLLIIIFGLYYKTTKIILLKRNLPPIMDPSEIYFSE